MKDEKSLSGVKLVAEDREDLVALSSFVQDAILRVGDIAFLPNSRRLALTLNRFCWERPSERIGGREVYRRVTAGLNVQSALAVKARGIDRSNPEGLLYVLSLRLEDHENQHVIEFTFAGGGTLRVEVETVDVSLVDLDGGWLTEAKPKHKSAQE